MRHYFLTAFFMGFSLFARAQQPTMPTPFGESSKSDKDSPEAKLKRMWETKVKEEWEAIKNKDKKTYGDLLADDYEGVEVDGKGERNKSQVIAALDYQDTFNYTPWGLKVVAIAPDASFVIYEVTLQYSPRSQIRYSRFYVSELWMKRAGRWKEVHYQETHVK